MPRHFGQGIKSESVGTLFQQKRELQKENARLLNRNKYLEEWLKSSPYLKDQTWHQLIKENSTRLESLEFAAEKIANYMTKVTLLECKIEGFKKQVKDQDLEIQNLRRKIRLLEQEENQGDHLEEDDAACLEEVQGGHEQKVQGSDEQKDRGGLIIYPLFIFFFVVFFSYFFEFWLLHRFIT